MCASRPRHVYVSSLESRDGELVQIDLNDPGEIFAYRCLVSLPHSIDSVFQILHLRTLGPLSTMAYHGQPRNQRPPTLSPAMIPLALVATAE